MAPTVEKKDDEYTTMIIQMSDNLMLSSRINGPSRASLPGKSS
jgi:hypothetical protein